MPANMAACCHISVHRIVTLPGTMRRQEGVPGASTSGLPRDISLVTLTHGCGQGNGEGICNNAVGPVELTSGSSIIILDALWNEVHKPNSETSVSLFFGGGGSVKV